MAGATALGLTGSYVGFRFLPLASSNEQQFAYPAVGAAVGIVAGLATAFGFTYLWNLIWTPYRILRLEVSEQKRQLAKIMPAELAEQRPPYPTPVVLVDRERAFKALAYLLHRGEELEDYVQPFELSRLGMGQLEVWLQRWLNNLQSDLWKFMPQQAGYVLGDDDFSLEREVYKYSGWNANLAARRVVLDRRLARLREVCSQIPGLLNT